MANSQSIITFTMNNNHNNDDNLDHDDLDLSKELAAFEIDQLNNKKGKRKIRSKSAILRDKNMLIKQRDEMLLEKDQIIQQKETELIEKDHEWNSYATSKSVSQEFLNVTSIGSQITLLVMLFATTGGDLTGFQISLVVLIASSLSLQFVIFVLLVVLVQAKKEEIGRSCTATSINGVVTSLTGLLMIISVAITAVSLNSDISGKKSTSTPVNLTTTN